MHLLLPSPAGVALGPLPLVGRQLPPQLGSGEVPKWGPRTEGTDSIAPRHRAVTCKQLSWSREGAERDHSVEAMGAPGWQSLLTRGQGRTETVSSLQAGEEAV